MKGLKDPLWNRASRTGMQRRIGNRHWIFRRDSTPPLLFACIVIPVTDAVSANAVVSLRRLHINHLLFLEGLKPYSKNEWKMNTIIHVIRILGDDWRIILRKKICLEGIALTNEIRISNDAAHALRRSQSCGGDWQRSQERSKKITWNLTFAESRKASTKRPDCQFSCILRGF